MNASELKQAHEKIRLEMEPSLEPLWNAHMDNVVRPRLGAILAKIDVAEEIKKDIEEDFYGGTPATDELRELDEEMRVFEDEVYTLAFKAHGMQEMAEIFSRDREGYGKLMDRGHYLVQGGD